MPLFFIGYYFLSDKDQNSDIHKQIAYGKKFS